MTNTNSKGMSRRQFLRTMGAAGAALTVLPGGIHASYAANSKLQVASIGVGRNLPALMSSEKMEFVALCDVDANQLENVGAEYPDARRFTDWRELFDAMGDEIDAVHVPTPDHSHAGPAMRAINMGKHAFVEKPLTHQVNEARQLKLAAQREGVVTQMGIQVHSSSSYRNAVAIVQSGIIGRVKEVHSWSDKTWGRDEDGLPGNTEEPPDTVNWDAWVGPAQWRDYAPGHYHRSNWRRWLDFGCGTMGDMGIHILDPVACALELGPPTTILSQSPTPFEYAHRNANRVRYTFAGTPYTDGEIALTWYDGRDMPEPDGWPELPDGIGMPGQGSIFLGEEGALLLPHGDRPYLIPEEDFADFESPSMGSNNHYHQWVNACLGEDETSAGFDYSGPLTEMLLLGVLACRFPTQEMHWDAEAMQFTNFSEANALLKIPYREGWEVEGLA